MPTTRELEEELSIAEAERDLAQKQSYEYAREIESLRGRLERVEKTAEAAGLKLALVPTTPAEAERQELDVLRTGINQDLQALDELRNPPAPEVPAETTLDIVRANQRERAELQQRMATANATLSRIGAALKIDRWDADGGSAIVDRVNLMAALLGNVSRKLDQARKNGATHPMFVAGLEWVLSSAGATKVEVDYGAPRIINFVVNGHDTPIDAKPEHTLKYLLGLALVRAQCTFRPVDDWLIYGEDGTLMSADTIARELKATSVVATLPVGVGA